MIKLDNVYKVFTTVSCTKKILRPLGILFLEKNPAAIKERSQALGSDTYLDLNPGCNTYYLDNFARYFTAQVDKYKPQHWLAKQNLNPSSVTF